MKRRNAATPPDLQRIITGPDAWPSWDEYHTAWTAWLIDHPDDLELLRAHYVSPPDDPWDPSMI